MMDKVVLKVNNVRCFVDDVVIFSKNIVEHTTLPKVELRILKGNELRLTIKKCYFMQPSMEL